MIKKLIEDTLDDYPELDKDRDAVEYALKAFGYSLVEYIYPLVTDKHVEEVTEELHNLLHDLS